MIPALGPVQVAALAVIADGDGLTVAEIAEHLGREPRVIHQAAKGLHGKSCIAVLTYRRGVGTASAVWGATTTGRAALAAHQQGVSS